MEEATGGGAVRVLSYVIRRLTETLKCFYIQLHAMPHLQRVQQVEENHEYSPAICSSAILFSFLQSLQFVRAPFAKPRNVKGKVGCSEMASSLTVSASDSGSKGPGFVSHAN